MRHRRYFHCVLPSVENCAKAPTVFIFESPLSVVLLPTESENHIREMELCLKMRPWAESFGILDYETRLQGTGRSETKMRRYFRGRQKRRQDNIAGSDDYIRAVNAKVPTIERAKEAPVLWFEQKLVQRLSINLQRPWLAQAYVASSVKVRSRSYR